MGSQDAPQKHERTDPLSPIHHSPLHWPPPRARPSGLSRGQRQKSQPSLREPVQRAENGVQGEWTAGVGRTDGCTVKSLWTPGRAELFNKSCRDSTQICHPTAAFCCDNTGPSAERSFQNVTPACIILKARSAWKRLSTHRGGHMAPTGMTPTGERSRGAVPSVDSPPCRRSAKPHSHLGG